MRVTNSAAKERRNALKRKQNKYRNRSNKLGIIGITGIVIVLSVTLTIGIIDAKKKLDVLNRQEEQLVKELEGQETRYKDLQERRVYVQTKKYIEETAKKYGLVRSDEVIFKPSDK